MKSGIKVCIYFKGKEKPMILTDNISKESNHEDIIKTFQTYLERKDQVVTLDFANDIIMFNCKDLESVKISKPEIAETITATEDELEIKTSVEPRNKDLETVNLDEDIEFDKDEDESDDSEAFETPEEKIEVVDE